MNPQAANSEIEEATVLLPVIGAKLAITLTLGCMAIVLLDNPAAALGDIYATNLRASLWLFLLEFVVGTYLHRNAFAYAIPAMPLRARWEAIAIRTSEEVWRTTSFATVNLLIRCPASILATSLILAWNGNDGGDTLVRIAAIIPGIACALARRYIKRPDVIEPESPVIRGTHLGNNELARRRAAILRAKAELPQA